MRRCTACGLYCCTLGHQSARSCTTSPQTGTWAQGVPLALSCPCPNPLPCTDVPLVCVLPCCPQAGTGAQGLAYVVGPNNGGIPPDLVLLDCSLPDMSGFDVCRAIRQMYNKQQVRGFGLEGIACWHSRATACALVLKLQLFISPPWMSADLHPA